MVQTGSCGSYHKRYHMAQDNDPGTISEQHPAGIPNDPYTRRRFLRAAVIGTAGVAGAAGVAGVARARSSGKAPSFLTHVLIAQQQQTMPPTFAINFEDAALAGDSSCSSFYGGGNGLERYFLFLGSNLPAGSYSFELTQQFFNPPNAAGDIQPTGTHSPTLPWEYQGTQPISIDVEAPGSFSGSCAGAIPATALLFGPPSSPPPIVKFSLGATSDALIYVHLVYDGTPTTGDMITLTSTLTGPVSNTNFIIVTAT
jgi:hypothetical protein